VNRAITGNTRIIASRLTIVKWGTEALPAIATISSVGPAVIVTLWADILPPVATVRTVALPCPDRDSVRQWRAVSDADHGPIIGSLVPYPLDREPHARE